MTAFSDHYGLSDCEVATRYSGDPRWSALRWGLDQLSTHELLRILAHVERGGAMVCDGFNYDEDRQLWCPLAVGLDAPRWAAKFEDPATMTNETAKRLILALGRSIRHDFSLNPMSGIGGHFFRSHREADVSVICRLLVAERTAPGTPSGCRCSRHRSERLHPR
jgi:hypothetical protein